VIGAGRGVQTNVDVKVCVGSCVFRDDGEMYSVDPVWVVQGGDSEDWPSNPRPLSTHTALEMSELSPRTRTFPQKSGSGGALAVGRACMEQSFEQICRYVYIQCREKGILRSFASMRSCPVAPTVSDTPTSAYPIQGEPERN
jgi:hypothetical protein